MQEVEEAQLQEKAVSENISPEEASYPCSCVPPLTLHYQPHYNEPYDTICMVLIHAAWLPPHLSMQMTGHCIFAYLYIHINNFS